MMAPDEGQHLQDLVATVAAAYFSNSQVKPGEVKLVIADIAGALLEAVTPERASFAPEDANLPAEPARAPEASPDTLRSARIAASITPDALISFEDGRPYKTLRRHLKQRGLTEAEYRARWGLPPDYPMVAHNYSASRPQVAKAIALNARGLAARRNAQAKRSPDSSKAPRRRKS